MPREQFFASDHGASQSVASVGGRDERHRPVLLQEALRALAPERGGWFFDATVGAGGHAEGVLEASAEARLIGVDRDREALRVASARLARFGDRARLVHADFRDIRRVLEAAGVSALAGVIADLGVSSLQLDAPERGFSFRFDAPLDMRMDVGSEAQTAAELLARLSEAEIARLLREYGEERRARLIARAIVQRRRGGKPVQTTRELAELVAALVRGGKGIRQRASFKRCASLSIASSMIWTSSSCKRPIFYNQRGVWSSSVSTRWRIASSSGPFGSSPPQVALSC